MGHTHPAGHSHEGHGGTHGGHEHIGQGDEPDVHGMFVCGEEGMFFSHLPMFGHPHHDFQALLEVTLTDDLSAVDPKTGQRKDPLAQYLADRKKTGQTLYTFQPKPFRLPDLVLPPGRAFRRAIAGSIVHGHFEKGGTPIATTLAHVQTIFHFRQFDPDAKPLGELRYVLFGKDQELFLAHLITRPPDFDQVVSVDASGVELTEDELRRGPVIAFAGRPNTVGKRLRSGEEVTGAILAEEGSKSREITFQVGSELYFEEGELDSPATFDQTEEEARAGFE